MFIHIADRLTILNKLLALGKKTLSSYLNLSSTPFIKIYTSIHNAINKRLLIMKQKVYLKLELL